MLELLHDYSNSFKLYYLGTELEGTAFKFKTKKKKKKKKYRLVLSFPIKLWIWSFHVVVLLKKLSKIHNKLAERLLYPLNPIVCFFDVLVDVDVADLKVPNDEKGTIF